MKVIRQQAQSRQALPLLKVKKFLGAGLLLLVLVMLSGCGDDAFICTNDDCVVAPTTVVPGVVALLFGSWDGGASQNGAFSEGAVYAATTSVAVGATTDLMVSLVKDDGTNSVYSPGSVIINITFDTTCVDSSITPGTFTGADATTTVTYTAGTCTGTTDTVTASVNINSVAYVSTVNISIP